MFSIVIPTHNRLDLLRDAVATVLAQDYSDWELVVFDNGSTDDIAGFVNSLSDSRVRYERSAQFLPVTDSWNQAIDHAKGSYITFLGDDDGLTPGYFTKLKTIIEQFNSPEVIYCNILQFLHPGVAPWEPRGYVADIKNGFFFAGRNDPFRMSVDTVAKAVQGSLQWRRNFTFNIQGYVFSQAFLCRLREEGTVFRSPFPDYYLANVALAKARDVVVVPEAMAIAGVSKASFGFTLFNKLEERGDEILNSNLSADPLYRAVEHDLLPGPRYNTNYFLTMHHVSRDVGALAADGVAVGRYRRAQTVAVLLAAEAIFWQDPHFRALWPRLSFSEKSGALILVVLLRLSGLIKCRGLVGRLMQRFTRMYGFQPKIDVLNTGGYARLREIFEDMRSHRLGKSSLQASAAP